MRGWGQKKADNTRRLDTRAEIRKQKIDRKVVRHMKCLDRFNQKMALSGGSLRGEHILDSKILLNETFADDASLSLGVYRWEPGLKSYEGKEAIGIRIYKRTFSAANGNTMKFQTLMDTPVVVGDILYDSIAGEYLICTEVFNIDHIHWQGKLTLCNWILKWQNKQGDILEYPCYDINSTQYNSGENTSKEITIGSSQHMLTLPCDENTVILSSPQRFFLDKNTIKPTSFIVTQNDSTSYNYGKKGLVKLTVYECATNNDADRFDLGICDYFEKDDIRTDNSGDAFVSKSVIFYDTSVIKSGGDRQIFTGKFFDDTGNEIAGVSPKWEIVCDFKEVLKIGGSGNQISIGIDNDDYVDEEFKLILSDGNGNCPSALIIRIESLL